MSVWDISFERFVGFSIKIRGLALQATLAPDGGSLHGGSLTTVHVRVEVIVPPFMVALLLGWECWFGKVCWFGIE